MKYRVELNNSINHLWFEIDDKNKYISNYRSRLIALNQIEQSRGGHRWRINYTTLHHSTDTSSSTKEKNNTEDLQAALQ